MNGIQFQLLSTHQDRMHQVPSVSEVEIEMVVEWEILDRSPGSYPAQHHSPLHHHHRRMREYHLSASDSGHLPAAGVCLTEGHKMNSK